MAWDEGMKSRVPDYYDKIKEDDMGPESNDSKAATADRPLTAMEGSLNELARNQSTLRDMLETLAERLAPVLRLKFSVTDEAKRTDGLEPSEHSKAVRQINTASAKVVHCQEIVAFLNENLEV